MAKEKTVPLGERLKFAAIFGSKYDEFFMVRVGSLYDQTLVKNNKTDNVTHMTAAEQIAAITPRVAELQAKCDKYFQQSLPLLGAGKGRYRKRQLHQAQQAGAFLEAYFQRELAAAQPAIVDSRHPFPFLSKSIDAWPSCAAKTTAFATASCPSAKIERVLFIKDGEETCFAFVEELVAHDAATIFAGSSVQKQCLFRVTRNADITVECGHHGR